MTESTWPLRMHDGTCLDASLLLPEGAPPARGWPAVLLVHGHGEDGSKASTLDRGRRLNARGIAAACLTVRGQGASEGLSFHLGARELFDLLEVIDALMALPDIDADRVAVCGSSQGGWHSWMAGCFHPRVRTVVPENIFVDYADFAVPQGCLSTWFFTRTMRRRVMSAGLQDLARQWAIAGDWDRLQAWLAPMSPCDHAHRIRCPVMVVHGWHDLGMPANPILRLLEGLAVPWQLVLGGGGHEGQDAEAAALRRTELVDAWMDHQLLDRGPAPAPSSVHWVERPGWTHREAPRFRPAKGQTLYLRQGGALDEAPCPGEVPNLNITHVPRDPRYDLAQALHQDLDGTLAAWPREELVFDGPALPCAMLLQGAPRFYLQLLSERPWLQVHAELWDMGPDGQAARISRGQWGTRSATPGRHLAVEIEGRATAWRVEAGHHLRVVVADQDPAHVLPEYRPYRARLFVDAARPSRVELPLEPVPGPAGDR